MNLNNRYIFFIILILLAYSPAQAHQLWINMTDYSPEIWQHPKYAPEPRAKTTVYFGWGHKYPVADFPKKEYLEKLFQIEPDGSRLEITPGENGFRAVELIMKTEGPRVLTASVTPGYYHQVKGKKDFHEMHYEMYAKALVSVGSIDGNPFEKPTGQPVEIIPLVNPNNLVPGDRLPVRVLFNGKPAENFDVKAIPMFSGTGESEEAKTDKNGQAEFVISSFYGPWILTASRMDPATEKYKEKCNTLYNLATLTFGIEKKRAGKKK